MLPCICRGYKFNSWPILSCCIFNELWMNYTVFTTCFFKDYIVSNEWPWCWVPPSAFGGQLEMDKHIVDYGLFMGFLDNKKDTQYFQPYPRRSGGSHGHFYKKTICRQTKDLQSAALTRNTMCGCFVRILHWLKVFWCCLFLFLTGFEALTSLFHETKTHLRKGWFLLQETNGRTAIYYLFFFLNSEYGKGKKKSGKTERHKRAQSLKPLRATTWNDTKLWRKSANAWCFQSRFWMFLLPTCPSWKCPQIFTEILPVWKKTHLAAWEMGCVGGCVGAQRG